VRRALQNGIYGQSLRQMSVTLGHLVMLEDRFVFGNLGEAPVAGALNEAANRVKAARKSVDDAIPTLAEWLIKRAAGVCH